MLDVASLTRNGCVEDLESVTRLLTERRAAVLLLATEPGEDSDQFLKALTDGSVQGVHYSGGSGTVRFAAVSNGAAGELASLSYPRSDAPALRLAVSSEAAASVVMSLDRDPSFVTLRSGDRTLFVWSTARVFDVWRPLAAEREFEDASDEYVPAIIFLRSVFTSTCWHNPRTGAGIVIDDPLLKNTYGFINFPELLRSARQHAYHVTLAFIPWNHWRSRKKNVKLFRDHDDCFSICAHGCDHTDNEFGSSKYQMLLRKTFVARERMERHHSRTGLSCVPLMVCPQERYSLETMRALADGRQFLGLVNTACIPKDMSDPGVCGADLLLPAQDSFFGCPRFQETLFERYVRPGDGHVSRQARDPQLSITISFAAALGALRSSPRVWPQSARMSSGRRCLRLRFALTCNER